MELAVVIDLLFVHTSVCCPTTTTGLQPLTRSFTPLHTSRCIVLKTFAILILLDSFCKKSAFRDLNHSTNTKLFSHMHWNPDLLQTFRRVTACENIRTRPLKCGVIVHRRYNLDCGKQCFVYCTSKPYIQKPN